MAITSSDYLLVSDLLQRQAAIVLGPGKEYLVASRLEPLARETGYRTLADLLMRLRTNACPNLVAQVIDAMTTNETSFFRDVTPFEMLRDELLPAIMEKRAGQRRLSIWSAASSSGQEIYSVLFTLFELGLPQMGWTIQLLGTDISSRMVQRAREGLYSHVEVNRGLTPYHLSRFFDPVGADFQVKDEFRCRVQFRTMNLATPWPVLPSIDIVLLRNVMIYLSMESRQRILSQVRRVMPDGGFLILGTAESIHQQDDGFERLNLGKSICYRLRRET